MRAGRPGRGSPVVPRRWVSECFSAPVGNNRLQGPGVSEMAGRDRSRRMLLQIAHREDRSQSIAAPDLLYHFGKWGLRALCSGHKPNWDAFVIAAAPLVSAVVARGLSASRQDDDVVANAVQDVFARLSAEDFRLLKSYDSARARLSTWLAVISWSAAIDARNARPVSRPSSSLPPAPDKNPAPRPRAAD
jgi:hypothetical protein